MWTRPNQTAFTLIEVMIAIGIFAVGAAMVATTFPAAILENMESSDYMMGTLIAENALAICRGTLRHRDVVAHGGVGTTFTTSSDITDLIPDSDRMYPVGDMDSRYGWIVAARHMTAEANDYQLAIVVYRRFSDKDTPSLSGATVTGKQVTASGGVLGAPVIHAGTGKSAKVIDGAGNLNISPGDGSALTVSNPDGERSPAFYCLVARMSLRF